MKKEELIKKIENTRSAIEMLNLKDDILMHLNGKSESKKDTKKGE